jgi:hypothetical protein
VAPANSAGFDAATATPGLRMDVKRRPNKNTKPLFQTKLKLFFFFFFGLFKYSRSLFLGKLLNNFKTKNLLLMDDTRREMDTVFRYRSRERKWKSPKNCAELKQINLTGNEPTTRPSWAVVSEPTGFPLPGHSLTHTHTHRGEREREPRQKRWSVSKVYRLDTHTYRKSGRDPFAPLVSLLFSFAPLGVSPASLLSRHWLAGASQPFSASIGFRAELK